MGLKFRGRHSDELSVIFDTESMPYIPSKRQTEIEVQGRDGQYVFEDNYNNIQIPVKGTIVGDNILDRRKKARAVASWLTSTGILVFDYEQDVEYKVVKVTNDISAKMLSREYKDEFTVIFECKPYQQQTYYNDSLSWQGGDSAWIYTNIPWSGYDRVFLVSPDDEIVVYNAGTYKALPIIKITGTATSVTIGEFTFTNLTGTIYIDCVEKVIYSLNGNTKVNKIVEGNFIELAPDANNFTITGTFTTLIIEFDYKNTYL